MARRKANDYEPFYVRVLYGNLNVRKAPRYGDNIIKVLPIRSEVLVVGEERGFYKIEDGWIDRKYTEAIF